MVEEIEIDFKQLKNIKWTYILLLAFLLFGFYLRAYHIDFPSIGYHNMKENEYYAESILFNEKGDFLHRRTFNFYGMEDGPGYFEEYAQPPLIPYLTVALWKVFGETIVIPRLIVIISMLAAIIAMYLLTKELTKNEYAALLSSFLLTIMPLGIYFGRNIQPESPALFFILLGSYFYVKWTEDLNKKTLLYAAFSLGMAGLCKTTFLIIGIPLLFITPWQKIHAMLKDKKEFIGQIKYGFLGMLPFIIIQGIFQFTLQDKSKGTIEPLSVAFMRALDFSFWQRTWPSLASYISDNYSWPMFYFAILGIVFVLIKYRTKTSQFAIGYLVALLIYLGITSGRIGGHAYYQMPFLPMVVLLITVFLLGVGNVIKQVIKIRHIQFAALLLLLLAIGPMQEANDRVWNTIFFGQDVVGEYIKQHTTSDDRFFNLGHAQAHAVCTYAERRCGDFVNTTQLIERQEKFNIKYMNIDVYDLSMFQNDPNYREGAFEYIQDNYKIVLIGAIPVNGQLSVVNVLLEKGGKFNITEVQKIQPQLAKTYTTKRGDVPFYIIENTQ